ncbi:hypothetical protein [Pseudomonas sp. Marseille-P9899]|uniref:hypothetical protein n=1 Tax=Pseudomonas sp. Marseille-P9899 TaxID=2730401 RepID=UPI001589FF37|nr:hypothetical protein [Pseudomonas sp. Marseille-P9899]
MSLTGEPNEDMDTFSKVADLLEGQMGRCRRDRAVLINWVVSRFRTPDQLAKVIRDLPQLPTKLRLDYAAWIHSFKDE